MVSALDKKNLFEAWLRDSVWIEHSDGHPEIIPRERIKEKIEAFINSGEYAKANVVAKQLSNPIKLTTNKKRKSVRVPFTTYVKLVENSLRQNVSLEGYVSNLVKKSLIKTVSDLKKREDVKRDRVEFLEDCLSGKIKPSSDESSLYERYAPRGNYGLSLEMPDNWETITKKAVAEARKEFVEAHETEVDPDILNRYLDLIYEEEFFNENLYETRPEITFSKNGNLILKLEMNLPAHIVSEETYNEILEEFGGAAIEAIEKAIGKEAFEVSAAPLSYIEEAVETEIGITDDGKLTIGGIQVSDDDPELKNLRQPILKDYDDEITNTKKELSSSLQNDDFNAVARLSKTLEELSNRRERVNFVFDLIALLLKRTQVVTFSLPECLLYAWEAYGEHDLSRYIFMK